MNLGKQWIPSEHNANWIFPERPEDTVNQYVDFLHVFEIEPKKADSAILQISADTDFVVKLNGELVGHGQYSDFADQKTFEQFSVNDFISQGSNSLAITVFYNGRNSSMYQRGEPGLVFALFSGENVLAASGKETLCRTNRCYHSGPIATVSGQLFYTFGYDAQGDDGLGSDEYVPGDDWSSVKASEALMPEDRKVLNLRPIHQLVDGGLTAGSIQSTGLLRRDIRIVEKRFETTAGEQNLAGLAMSDGSTVSVAWQMQNDFLSTCSSREMLDCPFGAELAERESGLTPNPQMADDGDGIFLVIDMGQQEVGHLELEISAPSGTLVDLGYGEHLDDLRVRTLIGGRNFAARYICKEGRQTFTHYFQRWAGRYLAMHVFSSDFTIYRLGLRRREYPLKVKSNLVTGDSFHGQVLEVAQRTLALCMHEHYEDTPWREQSLYANDARTQALCGYYAFGETAFPRSSFSLLGRGLREDNFICITAPSSNKLTIPSFTFCWILAVRDHYLYSGDDSLANEFMPQILTMLKAFLAERQEGLFPLRQGKEIWHFYDWSGMSGYNDDLFADGLKADSPLNCFLILAIEAAREILSWFGKDDDPELAEAVIELRRDVANDFWDADKGIFKTHALTSKVTQLTQALAVLAEVGSTEQRNSALANMVDQDSDLIKPGLSQTLYSFSALMKQKQSFGKEVLTEIENTWGKMLRAGATSFWETIQGARDFNNAGSLCHAWSAVPLYIYYHDLLGIRPTEPGFKSFEVDPVLGVLKTCEGAVPTPHGDITVKWETVAGENRYNIWAPQNCQCKLMDPNGILL